MQTSQIHLSQKQDILAQLFCSVFRICTKFRTFSKKDDPHSLCISKIIDHERRP